MTIEWKPGDPNVEKSLELARKAGAPHGTMWLQEALGLQTMAVQRIVILAEYGAYTRVLVQHGGVPDAALEAIVPGLAGVLVEVVEEEDANV